MSSSGPNRLGGNLVLASLLAILSYVPFELVAKGSLVVVAALFVLDPIPPVTRLLSLISTFVILGLTKTYRRNQPILQEQEGSDVVLVVEGENSEGAPPASDEGDDKKLR